MTLPDMQQQILDTLNVQEWSMPFTAEPAYDPRVLDAVSTPLEVFVVPAEFISERNDETGWTVQLSIDVAVTGKLPQRAVKRGTENVPDVTPYMLLCAEIVSFFKSEAYIPPVGFRVDAVSNSPAYDPNALQKNSRFISPIQIVLFAAYAE